MAPGYSGCNLCLRAIAPTDPRVNCLECYEYDLCANCALGGEEFPDGHLGTHRTRVFRKSGGGAQAPVASLSTTIVYRIPEAVQVVAVEPTSLPLAAVESLNSVLPELPPKPAFSEDAPPFDVQPVADVQPAVEEPVILQPVAVVDPVAFVEAVSVLQPPEVVQPVAIAEVVGAVQSSYVMPQVSSPESSAPLTYTPPPPLPASVVQRGSPPQSPAPLTYTPPLPLPASVVQRGSPPQSPVPVPPALPPRQSTVTFSPPPPPVVQPAFDVQQASSPQSAAPVAPVLLPRQSMIISSLPASAYTRSPSAALAALAQAVPAQPSEQAVPPQTQVPATPPPVAQPSTSEGGVSAYTMPPRGEPQPNTPRSFSAALPVPSAPPATPPPPPTAWGSFFDADMSPTPVFTQLIDAIFTYLDTRRTGNLTPEVYSRFLINQGYVGKQNIWYSNLVASMGKTKEECADAALKRAFDLFGIQYILRPRTREASSPPADVKKQLQSFGASFARALTPSPPAAGMMPLLTRAGFLSITMIEVLCDPARHYTGLTRILDMYELGVPVRNWGALPRGVLPDEPDARMLAKIARVQTAARERQSGQVRASATNAAGGLLSAAQSVVNKIDARETVNAINAAGNAINAVGNAMYIVDAVSNS